jgi:hypothetical protein
MESKEDLNATYWRALFVPVVITMLIFATMFVVVTTNVGQPHDLINKIRSPNIGRGFIR